MGSKAKSKGRRCPLCTDPPADPLREIELEGVKIDECRKCRGIWLDAGELERVRASRGVKTPLPPFEAWVEPHLVCPHCRASTLESGSRGSKPMYCCGKCQGHFADDRVIDWVGEKNPLWLLLDILSLSP